MATYAETYRLANYSYVEAALYLRLQLDAVRRWAGEGIVRAPEGGLSFLNLLEIHVLKGLRRDLGVSFQRIRHALEEYRETEKSDHPLLDPRLETDGIHLFLHDGDEYLNLNLPKQRGIPQVLSTYLHRIDRLDNQEFRFFPFVVSDDAEEPRTIEMSPRVAFGRPVLANTGIATEVIAGRFKARDSIADLAEEYGVSTSLIEDAVRWELPHLNAA
ncbi:MAG: DUF433 domain-containing protein [Terracidiphilus sp.]|nr:DUF433 domain-containing protein [Terracidiphilus sp.]